LITDKPFKLASLIAGPLVFTFIFLLVPDSFISPGANKTLALAGWMIVWWLTEAAPIPVTALLPLILFPFLGILKMNEAAAPYAHPAIFLFMGGFMIAIALEKHRLHERIALNLLKITGTSGNGIILGFVIATGSLSMWISNTATAMMMLPIALSVIELLKSEPDKKIHEMNKRERNFALGLLLCIGYASSIGGIATIIGTPPNVVFKGLLEQYFNQKITFSQWMLVGFPLSIILLAITYFLVTQLLFPNNIKNIEGTEALLRKRLSELGPISPEEKRVLAVFAFTSFLWIFQQAINDFVVHGALLNDTNIAMMGGFLMFIIPADLKTMKFLLDWKDTKNLQWGILILFGGGLCLAEGLENTHIIERLGQIISEGKTFNNYLVLLLIIAAVFLTELMSNVALVQIFVPVIFGISTALKVDPVLLAFPVTLSASMAFMFPISTPPNAVVFSTGYIRIKDMAVAGFVLNVISILVIWIGSMTLIRWVFS
jgi:solute carrier family 13 (sodium-dependent dicarboxylate transporter), member 2/3/5